MYDEMLSKSKEFVIRLHVGLMLNKDRTHTKCSSQHLLTDKTKAKLKKKINCMHLFTHLLEIVFNLISRFSSCICVKKNWLCSEISAVHFGHVIDRLRNRLERSYHNFKNSCVSCM